MDFCVRLTVFFCRFGIVIVSIRRIPWDLFDERWLFFQNRSNASMFVDFAATIFLDAAGLACR
jgi:hypothetical protein